MRNRNQLLEGGPSGPPAEEPPEGPEDAVDVEGIREKIAAANVAVALQETLIKDLNEKLEKAERRLERSENALSREREGLKGTKRKLDALLKENARLRRQVDDYAREVSRLRTKLERR